MMLRNSIGELRTDIRQWRREIARQMRSEKRSSDREAEYVVLHGRILKNCRNLAERVSEEEATREVLVRIDHLLRPWMNPRALEDAPKAVVADLLLQGEGLEMELAGKHRRATKKTHLLFMAAAGALLAGFLLVMLANWWTAGGWLWFDSFTAGIANRIRRSTFYEQFAVAVFFSWLVGTWMISAVYKS